MCVLYDIVNMVYSMVSYGLYLFAVLAYNNFGAPSGLSSKVKELCNWGCILVGKCSAKYICIYIYINKLYY